MDGMEGRLKEAAKYFEFNPDEISQEDYTFRTDMNFKSGITYNPEDLDLRKPGVWKPSKRAEFQVTTEEVLKKADFRNVRFLANFFTKAGILNKRSKVISGDDDEDVDDDGDDMRNDIGQNMMIDSPSTSSKKEVAPHDMEVDGWVTVARRKSKGKKK